VAWARCRGARLGRGGAVAAAAAGNGGRGSSCGSSRGGSRGGGRRRGGGVGARGLFVLADDKVDNLVAVAVNVQVVDGGVAAAVAVDVAGVAVRDDAAGVGLADGETGGGAVEELFTESATRSSTIPQSHSSIRYMIWASLTPLCTLVPLS
jgi:hypothetical protein